MTLRMSLLGLSGALMLLALGMVFLYAPSDIVLGVSQRIFYIHVPLALVGFLAFAVVAVCSVGYLWKGSERLDDVAYAAAEIGVLFTSLMLITGMLWAKPAWGVWWSWSPQLTTSLILWFLYARLPHAPPPTPRPARPARATPPSSASSVSSTSPSCTWPPAGGETFTRRRSSAPSLRTPRSSPQCNSPFSSASWRSWPSSPTSWWCERRSDGRKLN